MGSVSRMRTSAVDVVESRRLAWSATSAWLITLTSCLTVFGSAGELHRYRLLHCIVMRLMISDNVCFVHSRSSACVAGRTLSFPHADGRDIVAARVNMAEFSCRFITIYNDACVIFKLLRTVGLRIVLAVGTLSR